jgi:hypothetical protein
MYLVVLLPAWLNSQTTGHPTALGCIQQAAALRTCKTLRGFGLTPPIHSVLAGTSGAFQRYVDGHVLLGSFLLYTYVGAVAQAGKDSCFSIGLLLVTGSEHCMQGANMYAACE